MVRITNSVIIIHPKLLERSLKISGSVMAFSSIPGPLSRQSLSECVSYALVKLQMSDVSLKVEQRSSMKAIYDGRDVFVWLPTGYGKSLCISGRCNWRAHHSYWLEHLVHFQFWKLRSALAPRAIRHHQDPTLTTRHWWLLHKNWLVN